LVETGKVRVRKEVVTEHRTIEVPVQWEEIVIERHAPNGAPVPDSDIGPGEEIHIPVRREQVFVEKRPVVKEEVTVGKRVVQDTEHVGGEVRKEEVRIERVACEGDGDMHTAAPQGTTTAPGSAPAGADTGATASRTGEGARIQLREEELQVHKQLVETGKVRVRKEVVTEHRTIEVPVQREEIVIERHAPNGAPVPDSDIGPGEEIHIPVRREQVFVEKRPVVKEEVTVGKRVVQDTEHVGGEVRKEEVRIERVACEGDGDMHTAAPQGTTTAPGSAPAGADTGATASRTGEGARIQLREEELQIHKQLVETGKVRVRKEVVTEHRTIEVPVQREEIVIERHAPNGAPVPDSDIGPGEEIRIPVRREQVFVEKRPVVKEEVTVGKRAVQDTERVGGEVRKEEVRVEREGDVDIRETAS